FVLVSDFEFRIWSVIPHFLGRQPLNQPTAICLPGITKSIMQAVWTTLPEFHRIRFEAITAPVRRQWNRFVGETLAHLRHARVEHAPCVDYFALTRHPRAQLAPDRTRMKIRLRFCTRRF